MSQDRWALGDFMFSPASDSWCFDWFILWFPSVFGIYVSRFDLLSDHRSALDDLVAPGELSSSAAEQIQIAFQEATYHVWRSHAPMTCYEPVLVDYTPTSSAQLTQQVALLEEISDSGDVDQNTLAQAQAAIERDIAFLSLTNEATQALYDDLIAAAGETYDFPTFDELELEIPAESVEAARFLVELLLAE